MRYIICLLIGLVAGALLATTAASILAAQRDKYPRALMSVMQHELKAARDAASNRQCVGTDKALRLLGLLADDIETAMPHGEEIDRVFRQYVQDLRAQIGNAVATEGDCARQTQALTDLGNACSACHRDYR